MKFLKAQTFWSLSLPFFLVACMNGKKPSEPAPTAPSKPARSSVPGEEPIDVLGLQRSLGLEKSFDELGYAERAFDTCAVGYGYSSGRDCRKKHFVAINFRLQCRDSEGTVQNADYELTSIMSDQVKWNLGKAEGITNTDTGGFGRIQYIASGSQAQARLRITVNGKFLILTASEIRRVVVPGNWCPR